MSADDMTKDRLVARLDAAKIAPAVVWRCPEGCLVARAWWAAEQGAALLDQPTHRGSLAAGAKAHNRARGTEAPAPGGYDPNTLWIGPGAPWPVRVQCRRHAQREGLDLGTSAEVAERVRNAADLGRTLTISLSR